MTVEIGYALLSATLAAALTLGAVAGPTVLFTLPRWAEIALLVVAAVLVPVIFVARVVGVLWRFQDAAEDAPEEDQDDGGGQPSQPGASAS